MREPVPYPPHPRQPGLLRRNLRRIVLRPSPHSTTTSRSNSRKKANDNMKCVSKPVGAPKRATFATGNNRLRGSSNGLPAGPRRGSLQVCASMKELRDRIDSVKNTQKITDAMKLVAAAKVRRAQEAVVGGRPFSENLVKVLFSVNQRLRGEDVDVPLTAVRPVKNVLLVVCTGDRGLCGGFNNAVIKATEDRHQELTQLGIGVKMVVIGKKGATYFRNPNRASNYNIAKRFIMGQSPTTKEAQAIADEIFSEFVSEEADKVELIYTKFVSLIASKPVVQTLLPLTPQGEICDMDGNCVDAAEDEIFKLTTKEGKFVVEREATVVDTSTVDGSLLFEQDPSQILDSLLPLYMNSQILRSLQESIASELAARMNAMSNASDNAKELKKNLTLSYNRQRQAKITSEIIEIVAGANA